MNVINVVIVSNETQYKVKVKNMITGDDMAIVGYAEFKEEAKIRIEGYVPDVVVCAANSTTIDADTLEFIKSVQYQNTGTAIVLVTDKINVNLVNAAARIGIRQVFEADMEPEAFSNALRDVYALEQQLMSQLNISKRVRSKVYCFYGVKGGVGTSSLATNTAVSLAAQGKKVLLIALDLQHGDDNLLLNIDPKDTIVELSRDPDGISIERVNSTVEMHESGVSVLCAPKLPEYADYVNVNHINKLIENVRSYFEYILIDLGANFEDSTLTALQNCDTIFLIATLDLPCLKGLKATLNILNRMKVDTKAKLIINKNTSSLIKINEFENLLQRRCYSTIISDRNIVNKAMNSGIPFISGSPRSSVSRDVTKFANLMITDKEERN